MNTKRIFLALTFVVVMTAVAGSAVAQSNLKSDNTLLTKYFALEVVGAASLVGAVKICVFDSSRFAEVVRSNLS